ncbi:MAG: N-acetyltransferase family protein [Bacteroidota bacterium]
MDTTACINEASPPDYAAIAAIYNEYIEGGGVTMDEVPKTADDIAQWVAQFNDRERLFTLSENGVILGWGIIKKYSDRSGYRTTCETAVYLTQQAKGKGYGTFLKKHLLKVCESLGYRHLVAKILGGNEASIIYNQKLGYTIVGRQQQVGFRDGQWYDVVIMQYLIPSNS